MKGKKTFAFVIVISVLWVVVPVTAVFVSKDARLMSLASSISDLSARLSFGEVVTVKKPLNSKNPLQNVISQNSYIPTTQSFSWALENAPEETEPPFTPPLITQESDEIINALPYPDSIDDKDGTIKAMTYGFYEGDSYIKLENGGQVKNCTSVKNSTLRELSQKLPDIKIDIDSDLPQVLIYHTHTTESYEPYTRDFYDKDFLCKTTNPEMNMISVGEDMKNALEDAGINTLHVTKIHDYPSYNNAYYNSRQTVSEILEKYPSIKVVLDVHRDGIERTDGTRIAPTFEKDGQKGAQVMIISCCDNGGNIPLYEENFKLASLFQSQLEKDHQGITRPILFDYRFYNQDLSVGSLLIEIGSNGNSIQQAKLSGKLVGESVAKALISLE